MTGCLETGGPDDWMIGWPVRLWIGALFPGECPRAAEARHRKFGSPKLTEARTTRDTDLLVTRLTAARMESPEAWMLT